MKIDSYQKYCKYLCLEQRGCIDDIPKFKLEIEDFVKMNFQNWIMKVW